MFHHKAKIFLGESVERSLDPRPDFGENVGGGKQIIRGGATMIFRGQQKVEKIPYFYTSYI